MKLLPKTRISWKFLRIRTDDDIFPKEDKKVIVMSNLKNKFFGCFMGAIVGDALGMPYEFKKPKVLKR